MADSGFYAPGAIETLALHIKSFDDSQEVIDLRDICTEYNIYEDVYSHCLHAEVNINDALNIYDELPMCGDEVIELSFNFKDALLIINRDEIFLISSTSTSPLAFKVLPVETRSTTA